MTVQEYRSSENTIFGDVISHCKNPDNSRDRGTRGHESVHFINSEIRNANQGSERINGFYCLKSRAVIFPEPKMKKNDVKAFIPQCLKANRYNLYINGAQEWNNEPFYILDEYVAYVIGGMIHVEDCLNGVSTEWTDGVYGSLEFSIYAVALCLTIEKHDPGYFERNPNFKKWLHWFLIGAQNTFYAGRTHPLLKWDQQDQLLNALRTHRDAQVIRNYLRSNFGSVFLNDASNRR